MIQYGRQSISEEDIAAVVEVLRSDFLTQGPAAKQFETALETYCQAQHALVVSNGTAALHLACMALDIGPPDLVWVSAISFVASANCARYCGAAIDFVDVSPDTGLICPQALESKLIQAAKQSKLPKALIVVHLAGQSCDMENIKRLCDQYGIYIIEDACHALGGSYKGLPIGSCQYSDISTFSFHPVKPITSGEGGALLTNHHKIAKKARLLANHGITKAAPDFTGPAHGPWYYEMQELGFNYRLTDIQASLGLSQLKRISDFTEKRNNLAQFYTQKLAEAGLPFRHLRQDTEGVSAYHLYVVRHLGQKPQAQLYEDLYENGISCQLHYMPIFLHPYYTNNDTPPLPGAMDYYHTAITLPLYTGMNEECAQKVINALALSCR